MSQYRDHNSEIFIYHKCILMFTMVNKTKMIRVSEWTIENLKGRKIHPNQSYDEVIQNMIKNSRKQKKR